MQFFPSIKNKARKSPPLADLRIPSDTQFQPRQERMNTIRRELPRPRILT